MSSAPEPQPGSESASQMRSDLPAPPAAADRRQQPNFPMGDEGYQALLEVVLQQTLLAQETQKQGSPEELSNLLEIARRRRGEAFQVDPIGVELVQTVLERPFRSLVATHEQWLVLTRQIAQTLCDDTATYDRFRSLWRRLSESCENGN